MNLLDRWRVVKFANGVAKSMLNSYLACKRSRPDRDEKSILRQVLLSRSSYSEDELDEILSDISDLQDLAFRVAKMEFGSQYYSQRYQVDKTLWTAIDDYLRHHGYNRPER